MKINRKWMVLGILALSSLAFLPLTLNAAATADEQKKIDILKKDYPLDTCPVSGEKLDGSMGMKGPANTLPMMTGDGPFGPIQMGACSPWSTLGRA